MNSELDRRCSLPILSLLESDLYDGLSSIVPRNDMLFFSRHVLARPSLLIPLKLWILELDAEAHCNLLASGGVIAHFVNYRPLKRELSH